MMVINQHIQNIKNSPSCYVISETSLGIQCAVALLKEGYQVLAIISSDTKTYQWALKNQIPHICSIKEFEVVAIDKPFDYLFIIGNSEIIAPELLALPRCYAINYYDIPLLRYAGMHATTGDLFNKETLHNVSWHIMNKAADVGDILAQITFIVDKNETAVSLNLKCFIYALSSFQQLIKQLKNGSIICSKWAHRKKTYFSFRQKSSSFGFVFFDYSAQDIDGEYRALKYENYPNILTSFKILVNQCVYNPGKLEILTTKSNFNPGVIVNITKQKIQITTQTEDICLADFSTLLGQYIAIQDMVNDTEIFEGYKLQNPSNRLIKLLEKSSEDISLSEKFWCQALTNISDIQSQFIRYSEEINLKPQNSSSQKSNLTTSYTWQFKLNSKHLKETQYIFDEDILITGFLIYISTLGDIHSFTLGYVTKFLSSLSREDVIFFSSSVPLNVNLDLDLPAKHIVQYVVNKIAILEKNKAYFKDIFIREPSIKNSNPFLSIIIHKGNYRKIVHSLEEGVLLFNVDNKNKTYGLYSKSNDTILDQRIIRNFSEHLNIFTKKIIQHPEQNLKQVLFLTKKERKCVFQTWNQTDKDYPSDKTIQQLFEEQVIKTPDNIAVVYEGIRLSYKELNARANQLACYLINQYKIAPDDLVALCLDRSEHMLIAILGTLKAGAAYVPMDPNYPDERIRYILQDTQTRLVLTNEIHKARLEVLSDDVQVSEDSQKFKIVIEEVLALDSASVQEQLLLQSQANPETETTSANLAYVIYTSGTTGNPKGVMIEHKALISKVYYLLDKHEINSLFNIAAKIPYTFDPSLREIFLALLSGAKLVVLSEETYKNIDKLINCCIEAEINLIIFVPSHLFTFLSSLKELKNQRLAMIKIKILYSCGEILQKNLVNELKNCLPNIIIKNQYGPTESCLFSFECDLTNYNTLSNSISVDKIVNNMKGYILSNNQVPLPIGAIGELYIGGIGLARGYLNRSELTAEKFIANPFQNEEDRKLGKNARLYKTGDLVRWLPDGNLEYIGRNDFQVKIRGYRIELGEIESALYSYEGIKQNVVLARDYIGVEGSGGGNKYLVGYYVSDTRLDEEDILNYLQIKLPEYMVPTALVRLEKLPLTINGKLDRKALPDPELGSSMDNGGSYVAPRNELETKICSIWAEVLGLAVDRVGINDDFFRLGGDSIVSIQLVSRLRQRLGFHISVKDIFSYRNIERLSDNVLNKLLVNNSNQTKIKTEQGLLSGEVSLLPIQQWFFENGFTKPTHWNQSFIIQTPELNIERLSASIGQLVAHHDQLIASFNFWRIRSLIPCI